MVSLLADARSRRTGWALLALALPLLPVPGIAAGPVAGNAAGTGAPIEVEVANVRSAEGLVHVDVCTEAQFLKNCPIGVDVPAHKGSTIVTLPAIAPGRYALQAYHDRNSNHKVDRNWIGMPTEDVGFSNDAPIRMAPPKFAIAAFDHGEAPQHLIVHLTDKFY